MAESRRNEDWIAEQLKGEASRHEPDLDRIKQRIRERGLVNQPGRRSAWLVPAAAAATFVVLSAGAITALHAGRTADVPGAVQVVGPTGNTGSPSATASPADRPSPAHSTPSSAPKTSGSPAVGKPKPSASAPTANTASRRVVEVALGSAAAGRKVTIPSSSIDWVAAGSADASATVRRAKGEQLISGPHEHGSGTSTTTSGPFALSWSGGLSEPSHTGSRSWRTVTGPIGGPETGLRLRAPAGKQEATLVLYVGANGADGLLRTNLGAQGKVRTTRLKAVDSGGYVVTIRFHTEGPNDELNVELIGGSGGSISFAAAVLR
ncbi:MAG TPA: hypothetical protein VLL08_04110 [Kineosporiaceae bacterium]|nr:hypothetical protein [Kineosporiaceae bacterium]